MSLTLPRRREACLHFIENGFDSERTVAWMLKTFADEPSFLRAKNKARLALNTITIGGQGDQQQLNMIAFQGAITEANDKLRDRREAEVRKEMIDLRNEIKTLQVRNSEHVNENSKLQSELRGLMERAHDSERKQLSTVSD